MLAKLNIPKKFSKFLNFRFLSWLFIFLLYISFASFGRDGPNPGSRFMLTKSLALYGDINVTYEDVKFYGGGIDFAKKGDNYYSDKPPGLSFLVLPLYYIGNYLYLQGINLPINDTFNYLGDANAFFLIVVFLTAVASYGVLKLYDLLVLLKFRNKISFYSALIFAFVTIFWGYVPTLFSHGIATTALILTIYLFLQEGKRKLLLSGLFAGFLATVDYATLAFIPIFLVYLFYKYRISTRILLFILGLVVPLGFLLLYNYTAFDSPFSFSYQNTISFREVINLNTPLLNGLYLLLFSTWRGLFFFNPILIFSIVGIFLMFQKNKSLALFFATLWITHLISFASNDYAWGGVSYGPRHLILSIPILIIFLAEVLTKISYQISKLFGLLFLILLGVSLFHSFLGAYVSIFAYPETNQNPIYEVTFSQFLQGISNSFLAMSYPNLFWSIILISFIGIVHLVKKS